MEEILAPKEKVTEASYEKESNMSTPLEEVKTIPDNHIRTKATTPNLRTQEVDPSTLIAESETAPPRNVESERTLPYTAESENTSSFTLNLGKVSPTTLDLGKTSPTTSEKRHNKDLDRKEDT